MDLEISEEEELQMTNRTEAGLIMDLPEEVRGVIFNKLSQDDAKNCRLVCGQWRREIDDFFEFKIYLDTKTRYLDWILNLRIKECRIKRFFEPYPLSTSNSSIFKHPTRLRNFDNGTYHVHYPAAMIHPANFHNILLSSAEYLQKLCLLVDMPIMTHDFPTNFRYNFENLRKLDLTADFSAYDPVCQTIRTNDILDQLISESLTPNLKNLRVHFYASGGCDYPCDWNHLMSLVLVCISKRRLTPLEVFIMSMWSGKDRSDPPPLQPSNVENVDFNRVDRLKKIELNINSAMGINCWYQLLANQKHLEVVWTQTIFTPVPASLLRQIVLNNWQSLVEIDIVKLDIGNRDDEEERSFDMSVFQDCYNLQKLRLRRGRHWEINVDDAVSPCLINLYYLPLFMAELALENFKLLTEDLSSFCLNSRDLKLLTLQFCGKSGAFGITGSVLNDILAFKSLGILKLKDFNLTVDEESNQVYSILDGIINKYGYGKDSKEFAEEFITLIQNTTNHTWTND